MALIKAALGALTGNLADQWKEMIYCESLGADVLCVKGQKRVGARSSNTKGDDNVISNGSIVVVNDGQCMVIVEQGKVVDFCAEAGEYTYDSKAAPSVFTGGPGSGLLDTFKNIGKRFTFGGDTGLDQRVYYFNTKEVMGNRYGTPTPVPFRVVDRNIGLDMDIAVRCNGEFSFRLADPLLFYQNVCGNVEDEFTRDRIASQLRSELLTALQPAFARISEQGVRYSAVPAHTEEVAAALSDILSKKWRETRGIQIVSFGVNAIAADAEDEKTIKELQRTAVMRDPRMAAASLTSAQGDAMRTAAGNGAGAFVGFAGMNMAQMAGGMGGMNAQSLFQMGMGPGGAGGYQGGYPGGTPSGGTGGNPDGIPGGENPAQPGVPAQDGQPGQPGKPAYPAQPVQTAQPEESLQPMQTSIAAGDEWTCPSCGTKNRGKFCQECGTPRPKAQPRYRCNKCGWVPQDQTHPPKFCPECGDRFDENDVE
ncbi:MAG: SPFH domain-containing protein [Atopobiaceae bacterium]